MSSFAAACLQIRAVVDIGEPSLLAEALEELVEKLINGQIELGQADFIVQKLIDRVKKTQNTAIESESALEMASDDVAEQGSLQAARDDAVAAEKSAASALRKFVSSAAGIEQKPPGVLNSTGSGENIAVKTEDKSSESVANRESSFILQGSPKKRRFVLNKGAGTANIAVEHNVEESTPLKRKKFDEVKTSTRDFYIVGRVVFMSVGETVYGKSR